jgi:hypothetical protein
MAIGWLLLVRAVTRLRAGSTLAVIRVVMA